MTPLGDFVRSATSRAYRYIDSGADPVRMAYVTVSAYSLFACWQIAFGWVRVASWLGPLSSRALGAAGTENAQRAHPHQRAVGLAIRLAATREHCAADPPPPITAVAADRAVAVVPPMSYGL